MAGMAMVQKELEFAYNTGDIIYTVEPWAYSVDGSQVSLYCYLCLQTSDEKKLRKCAGCLLAHYCSVDCQRRDWKNRHKAECPVLCEAVRKELPEMALNNLSIMLKVCEKLKKGELGDSPGACTPTTKRTFDNLVSRNGQFPEGKLEAWQREYDILKPYLQITDAYLAIPDFPSFCTIYGKLMFNGFDIGNRWDMDRIGQGFYLGPSDIDHSCRPNAIRRTEGTTMIVKAIIPIATYADIRMQYFNTFSCRSIRRETFRNSHFCDCNCNICNDSVVEAKRLAFRCQTKECSEPIPLNDTAENMDCQKCGATNCDRVAAARLAVDCLTSCWQVGQRTDIDQLRAALSSAEKVLHSTNFVLGIACKDMVLHEQSVGGSEKKIINYLIKANTSARLHLGTGNFWVMQTAMTLASRLIAAGRMIEAAPYAEMAREGIGLRHDRDSELYQQWCFNELTCKKLSQK